MNNHELQLIKDRSNLAKHQNQSKIKQRSYRKGSTAFTRDLGEKGAIYFGDMVDQGGGLQTQDKRSSSGSLIPVPLLFVVVGLKFNTHIFGI